MTPLGRWEEEARRLIDYPLVPHTYGCGCDHERTDPACSQVLVRGRVAQALADAERRTWERACRRLESLVNGRSSHVNLNGTHPESVCALCIDLEYVADMWALGPMPEEP